MTHLRRHPAFLLAVAWLVWYAISWAAKGW